MQKDCRNNPCHALVANGLFQEIGVFRVLSPISTALLEAELRERVFAFLKNEGGIDEALIARMRAWRHSGFSVHNGIRVQGSDSDGRWQLARYMIRAPVARFPPYKYRRSVGMGVGMSVETYAAAAREVVSTALRARGGW